MDIVLLCAGLVVLIAGGEMLVRGAVAVARLIGVSPAVIGLTFVGFGTSAPELVTSLQAGLAGAPGIAIGNVVGSNIANILLILGLAALVRPLAVEAAAFRRDGAVLAVVSLVAVAALLTGSVERWAGALGLALLAGYITVAIRADRRRDGPVAALHEAEAATLEAPDRPVVAAGLMLVGLGLTLAGARMLVAGAVGLAQAAGLSEAVIGLTIVAVGTSMPELVTSVMAARRGESGVAIGNVIGSNIFNLLGILGATALVVPLAVPAEILRLDVWVMLAATAALLVVAGTGARITRGEGAVCVLAYGVYLGMLLAGVV
ncbi:calcium/sodium antiporter [Rhodovulum marinum]|uniref:Cation:H+ antiporter n=1 Tax=Rhodovulum marinum TaxID=320662 RepID=A0A4R2PZT0_9RHOB|nr:calcium/sodium antiporter [Rhodovulum marinum]TCP41700.1 cation:H+ antiporter [Rhodovulum marinum]